MINYITVRAEDKVRTIQSEINKLSVEYKVSSSTISEIVKCESSMYGTAINHNLDKNGKIWSSDYGPLQINDYYHEDRMNKLELDIHNQWDSLEYGIMLFKEQGTKPWSASKKCWLTKI